MGNNADDICRLRVTMNDVTRLENAGEIAQQRTINMGILAGMKPLALKLSKMDMPNLRTMDRTHSQDATQAKSNQTTLWNQPKFN